MMSRWSVRCVACVLQWLTFFSGQVVSEEVTMIGPSTTIVTIDGVKLSAGRILVPAGGELHQWWNGKAHDFETQQQVREKIEEHIDLAIDNELLRSMLSGIRERGGPEKALAVQSSVEKNMPILRSEARQIANVDAWSKDCPDAEPYISDWITAHTEAILMARLAARAWLEKAEKSNEVNAYWISHREDYLILRSGKWRQITVANSASKDVILSLEAGQDFEEVAKEFSRDQYREDGGMVQSEIPHLLIHDIILTAIRNAQLGEIVRIENVEQVIFLKAESLDVIPGEWFEVVT